jgi:CRISPR-associated protein Csm3
MAETTKPSVAKPLVGKVVFRGLIRSVTGLHIGGSKEVLEIGALDLPVIREPVTKEPYIPGSSLKGKFRSLLEKKVAGESKAYQSFFSRNLARASAPVWVHVCETKEDAHICPVCRLFGSSAGPQAQEKGSNFPSRLRVRDAYFPQYTRNELLKADTGFLFTELKYENSIDRITSAANPRQIERVPPGADFCFEVVYDVEDLVQLPDDLKSLMFCFSALEDDSLGGHGSRGSGKVLFHFGKVLAKKVAAYVDGASNSNVLSKGEAEISRQTDARPQEDQLLSIEAVRSYLDNIAQFYGNEVLRCDQNSPVLS